MKSGSENYLLEHKKHVKLFQIGTSCLSLNGKVEQVIKIFKITGWFVRSHILL